jgi:hypothetical protein
MILFRGLNAHNRIFSGAELVLCALIGEVDPHTYVWARKQLV